MGEIIQYEGFDYQKVNRKARTGDVAICRNVRTISSVEQDKPYKVLDGWKLDLGNGMRVALYHGRTEEDVDVYERVVGYDEAPNVQTGTIECEKVYTNPLPIKPAPTDEEIQEGMNLMEKLTKDSFKAMQNVPVPESEQDRQIRYLNHPFYKDAREFWQDTQDTQIYKGAEKYGEPFTPSSWTARQLLDHAMQENVDQAHYIYGMYMKMQEMEKELKELREFRDQVHKTVVKWGAVNEPESGNA